MNRSFDFSTFARPEGRPGDTITVARLTIDLDVASAPAAGSELCDSLETQPGSLIVFVGPARFVGVAGVDVFCAASQTACRTGTTMVCVAQSLSFVRVVDLLDLRRRLSVVEDVWSAAALVIDESVRRSERLRRAS